MMRINCLITTPKHREIAAKLGLNPTIVTNLAALYASEHPGNLDITEEIIKSLIKERENITSEAYLAIPKYTKMGVEAVKNGPLASTDSKTGEIKLWTLPKDNPMDYFYNYISGNIENNSPSKQKQEVFKRIIDNKELSSINEIKEILQTPFEAYQFLLWHEMAHKQYGDTAEIYWANGRDLMTPDKLDIEYRATLDALKKAKEYRRRHPATPKSSPVATKQMTDEQLEAAAVDFTKKNLDKLINDYISTAENENTLDPDKVREVYRELGYNGKNVPVFRKAEKILVEAIFEKMIENAVKSGKKSITFLTGIPGSGKSTSLKNSNRDLSDQGIVYDAAFNDVEKLIRYIQKVQEKGLTDVQVIAVHNDALTAFKNTLERASRTGRTLSVKYFLDEAFKENADKIYKLTKDCPDIKIIPIDNSGNNGGKQVSIEEALGWDYNVDEELFFKLLTELEDEINERDFSGEQIASIIRGVSEIEESSSERAKQSIRRIERQVQQNKVNDLGPQGLSPLGVETQPQTLTGQLIEHLKSLGIPVKNRTDIEEFLKTHNIGSLQQAVEYTAEIKAIKEAAIKNSTFMKAPNGKTTNLTEQQWLQVRTKAFKNWFGDWENDPKNASKVVDENGEPLVVYHGGENNISSFITYHQDSEVGDMYGAYFTKDKKYAKSYNKGTLYEVFLNIREPLTTEGSWTGIINKDQVKDITAKHDGIVNDKFDNGILYKLHLSKTRTEIIVFNPNQIKSATDNNGMFSTENNDIQAFYDTFDSEVRSTLSSEEKNDIIREIKKKDKAQRSLIDIGGNTLYLVDHTDRDGFDSLGNSQTGYRFTALINIRDLNREEIKQIKNIINSIINEKGISGTLQTLSTELERNGFSRRLYNSDSLDADDRATNTDNVGLDNKTQLGESIGGQSAENSSKNLGTGQIKTNLDGTRGSRYVDKDGIPFFTTHQGEIYGFVDLEGNIYLDETVISPEHPIHEYTHLWDRVVQQKNPKLWQRGVALMKQTSLWNKIFNDENYGKRWQAMNITGESLENLIASEVHARFTGQGGERLLNQIAKEQGQSDIISKLKQWIIEFWKGLKATFSNWSQEDIDKLTLTDFNHMVVMDFADGVKFGNINNSQQQIQQSNENSVERAPKVGIDRVKVDNENPIMKLSSAFTPIQRRDRVKIIAKWFSDEITGALFDLIEAKEDELNNAIANNDKEVEQTIRASLDLLNDPVKGRQYTLNHVTVNKIVERIQFIFTESRNHSKTDYEKQQYQNVLDNFEYLLGEAASIIGRNENIKLNITRNNKTNNNTSEGSIGGIAETIDTNIENNDRERDDDDESGNRATGNDGWSYKVRFLEPYKTASKATKEILRDLVKVKNLETVELDEDDLGIPRYVDAQYAHKVLLDKLSSMIDDTDFCRKIIKEDGNVMYEFPALEALVGRYPWVNQIIQVLIMEPNKISAFFTDFRKDFISYWGSIEEDSKVKTVPLNQASSFSSAKNQFIDNYEMGNIIDKDSIYDSSRRLSSENIAKGLKLVNIDLHYVDDENIDAVCDNFAKAIRMLGLPIEASAIKSIYESPDGLSALFNIKSSIGGILTSAKKHVGEKNFHLISSNNTDFNILADIVGEVTEIDSMNSFNQNDKTYQSYSAPNYLNTQIKLFKSETRRQEYLDREFKAFDWFYDRDGQTWRGSTKNKPGLLELIETDENVRDMMKLKELLVIDRISYEDWSPFMIHERFITEYFSAGEGYGYYNYPIFADSGIAMMIRLPRYENYEEEIIPRLRQVVLQELYRINLVNQRTPKDVSPIANFDGLRGKSFCFFPFLNTWKDKSGKSFKERIAELKKETPEAINEFIDSVMRTYMQEESQKFVEEHQSVVDKLVKLKLDLIGTKDMAEDKLKEYFYNHHYMTTQIIQMTTTDLAFYKDGNDFQKRYKEVYASGNKLNTQSEFGREFEKTIYLSDQVMVSSRYLDIKSAVNQVKEQWIKDGMETKVAEMTADSILHKFRNVNATDAQAIRSLSSFKSVLDMLGVWDKNMEDAFNRIKNGKWNIADFNVIWESIKPFVYTQISKDSGVDGINIKVPHQNKNSEFLLLSMHYMIASSMQKSPQLVAINKFMEDHDIDVVQFESAVKVGGQGAIDLTYSNSALQSWINNNEAQWEEVIKAAKMEEGDSPIEIFREGNFNLLDSGKITQEEYNDRMSEITPTENETTKLLEEYALNEDGSIKPDVVHIIPYKDYMLAQPTVEHFFDRDNMSEAVFGSQFRNLIVSDIPSDAIIKVHGKNYTKQELLDLYNSLIVENLLEDYKRVYDKLSNIETFQAALLNIAKGNPKFDRSLIDALQLVDWTDPNTGETKKVFNIPLYTPSIVNSISDVVTSMFKNAVTKQKIKGAACILVSNFGFTDKLHIEYNKSGDKTSGVKYVECYMPWYSKKYFEPFLKTVTRDGITYQEIDINEVPSDLLEMVGYRIPTEDKYSMVPLKVVGFLPQQNDGTIMLPADITTISGADFDVDKLYLMMPSYKIEYYDKKRAIKYFQYINGDEAVNKLLSAILRSDEVLEETTTEEFQEWWSNHKEEYRLETPIINKVRWNPTKTIQEQSREARDNMIIDISLAILRHPSTIDKFLNPGSFDNLKLAERINTIISDRDLLKLYADSRGIIVKALFKEYDFNTLEADSTNELLARKESDNKEKREEAKLIREALKNETLESLNDFLKQYKSERDPLSLETFSYYHKQNTTGGKLIGIYANNTSAQAKYQGSGIALKKIPANQATGFKGIDYTFTIDGKTIESLDQIISPWGERISKNCAEFSAASVDNVKDPVLAGLLQNEKTASIACFMLNAGIPIRIIGLLFNQPIIKESIEKFGKLDYIHIKKAIGKLEEGHISITTDELMDTILVNDISSSTARKIATLMLNIQKMSRDYSSIIRVSRADSPNGAIAINLGAARNQVQNVTALNKKSENNSFSIAGLNKALIKNNISATSSIEELRDKINKVEMPRLQAFYSLGIALPMQLMSKFFIQLDNNLDKALQGIYEQAGGVLDDTFVNAFYRDYIEYMLTGSTLFGNDSQQTLDEKRDYYLYTFPEEFFIAKQKEKFEAFDVIKKIRVKDGVIIMRDNGRLTPDIKESLITDFDTMIASEDPEVVQMALDLFMYSFYKNSFYFGYGAFGNFFSPFFMQQIPEFIESLREIEQKVPIMDTSRFVSQYYNNYWENITFKVKDKQDFFGIPNVMEEEYGNPYSNIIVQTKDCINPMTGMERKPYYYIQYNGGFYKLITQSNTTSTYARIVTSEDAQGKKYNSNQSVQEMADYSTPKALIDRNKQIGAKKSLFNSLEAIDSFDDFDDSMFDQFEDLESQLDGFEGFDEADFQLYIDSVSTTEDRYKQEDSEAELDIKLC